MLDQIISYKAGTDKTNDFDLESQNDEEIHDHRLTSCQKFKYLVGCGVRLQTLVIGYFFLFVETSNVC